ncbi:hypothetical protein HDU76_003055 [Blyttiomyces sp. JEL0837]|nr:hypothetical protein HDU76_003055 [Blyttiomyces sp. JEL0837]
MTSTIATSSLSPVRRGPVLLEVCLETVESAVTAGGTTPSFGTVKLCKELLTIPIMVMIRPRGGDFLYNDFEIEVMKRDIQEAKTLGVAGVVFGLLKKEGSVDIEKTKMLVELARPMQVTFHRAFDVSRDPFEALEDIISIGGIQRILTSGQDSGALEGLDMLAALVEKAKDRIQIMPGGGVTPRNVRRILSATNVPEIHMAIMKQIESPMKFRNPNVFMGVPGLPEYSRLETDGEAVKKVVQSLLGKMD